MLKQKILIFIDWYLPGYKAGGPIRSVANIVNRMGDEFEFHVFTSDRDLGEKAPFSGIITDKWLKHDKEYIYYCSKENLSIKTIVKILKENNYNRIYINSLFSFYYSILPILIHRLLHLKSRVILAPRGMLGQGALKIKQWKKKLFLLIAKTSGLYNKIRWHASTTQEENEIRNTFGIKAEVICALNIPETKTTPFTPNYKTNMETVFVFISRISEKKNLHFAISLFKKCANHKIIFNIYGPIDNISYWESCKDEIKKLPSNIHAEYKGEAPHHNLENIFKTAHFFILPTLHENYGHAIVESFSYGIPVVISTETPWRNLQNKYAGWDIPLNKTDRFSEILTQCCNMDNNEYLKWSEGSYNFGKEITTSSTAVEQHKKIFQP